MDIVEVTAHFFKEGDIITYEDFESDCLFETPFDETIENYKEPLPEGTDEITTITHRELGDVIFTKDNIVFSFNWVGVARCPMNATDYMVEECGIEDTFGEDLEYFVEIAKRKLIPEPKKLRTMSEFLSVMKKKDEETKYLKFLLKYEYKSWKDFDGECEEWDCSYECKGELEI